MGSRCRDEKFSFLLYSHILYFILEDEWSFYAVTDRYF